MRGKEIGVNDFGDGEVVFGEAEVDVVESDFVVGYFILFQCGMAFEGSEHDDVDLLCGEGLLLVLPRMVLLVQIHEHVVEE